MTSRSRIRLNEVPALSLLILLVLLLATLALLGVALAGSTMPAVSAAIAPICAVALLAGLAGRVWNAPASLTLPIGFPGQPSVFAIDRISLAFLPAAALAAAATSVTVSATHAWRLAVLMAASLLVLCAGNASLLVIGAGLAWLASGRPGVVALVFTLAASLAGLLPHTGLLPQDSLPAMRTATGAAGPSTPVLLVLVPVLMLIGAGGEGIGGALLPVLGSFLLVRVLFDLSGPSPFAWGLIVAASGLAGGIERGVRAVRAGSLETVLTGLSGLGGFVALTGFGVALAARSADLPAIASASLAAGCLLVLQLACAIPLASIATASVAEQAGSRWLGALGGLQQPMPRTMLAALVAGGTIVGLPPLAGFAPIWLVVQSLLSAQRFGGLATPVILAVALASLGLALSLGLVAGYRLVRVTFGGRPRTPRGAAASEARPAMLRAMSALAVLLLLGALLPGPLLRFYDPVVAALTGATMASRAGPFSVQAVAGGTLFSPLATLVLLAGPAALALWAARRTGPAAEAPAWDGGAGPPPEWLPFGEPRAQASAPGFARLVLSALGLAAGTTLPGEGAGRADRSQAPAWRTAAAAGLRALRRTARSGTALDRLLLPAGPGLLALLLASVLAASVLAIGGRSG